MILKTSRVIRRIHTVTTRHGVLAGYEVRGIGSTKIFGYIWQAGSVWRWRTPGDDARGERATQRAAIDVLTDIADLASGPRLPLDWTPPPTDADILTAWRGRSTTPTAKPVKTPVAQVEPVAAKPEQRIVWNDAAPAFDVTAAIRSGFKK